MKAEDSNRFAAKPAPENLLKSVLDKGVRYLSDRGIEPAKLLAERFLENVLGCKRFELYLNAQDVLSHEQAAVFFSHIQKRGEGIPSQYIVGQAEFMDFTFKVNPSVLIPRPETEFLVEKAVDFLKDRGFGRKKAEILDVGTGSGNIAVSVASYLPKACVWAVDISLEALEVARWNAMRNEVGHRIQFLPGDLLGGLPDGQKFDLIISNPPYLSEQELREIPAEVAKEPSTALLGGKRGDELIRRLIEQAGRFVSPGGSLFFEIGCSQGPVCAEHLRQTGWNHFEILKDYQGLDRVVAAWKDSY